MRVLLLNGVEKVRDLVTTCLDLSDVAGGKHVVKTARAGSVRQSKASIDAPEIGILG